METNVTLNQIEAQSYQQAVDDTRKPTRYEVLVDGIKVGEVWTQSNPSYRANRGSRLLGARNGFSREWEGSVVGDWRWKTRYNRSRTNAVAEVVKKASEGRS